jgi:hypothetical protein
MSFLHDWRLNYRAERLLATEFGFKSRMGRIVRARKRQCFDAALDAGGNEYDMAIGFVMAGLHVWLETMPEDEALTPARLRPHHVSDLPC